MAATLPTPRASKSSQNFQLLSYELPHRAHAAKVYPIKSPNGSTVILYGHENGVKIIWRGGRPFKPQSEVPSGPQKPNGARNTVISLDSDDEGSSLKPFEDKPEFEEGEEEPEPSQPYPTTVQSLDLRFGTEALHLALLPASVLKADGPSWNGLEPLQQMLVFAAACADNVIRLVTLPLTPPSPRSKERPEFRSSFTSANAGNGNWGEKVTILQGHQRPADGLSMTLDFAPDGKSVTSEPQIIVASHSREVTGCLLLFRVPLKAPKPLLDPFQAVYLSSPAKSISFSPGLSKQHSSQLLVAEQLGVCRIYDYKLLTRARDDSAESQSLEQGTWLLSLYAGFQTPKGDNAQIFEAHAGFGRKPLVDAQWISSGRAIIILMNDGEWGIWDIEGVGPGASQSLLSRHGIKGGSKAVYSLKGYIDGAKKSRASGPPQMTSKFAPMTPGTRKIIQPFSGREPNGPVPGQISVVEVPSASTTNAPDESVLFWLGETYAIIPNLAKYWGAQTSKTSGSGSLFGSASNNRIIKLEDINLQGERCTGVEQIAKPRSSSNNLPSDILVLGEHRFMTISSGKPVREQFNEKIGGARLALVEKTANGGDLDVTGIEEALARMEKGSGAKRKLFQS